MIPTSLREVSIVTPPFALAETALRNRPASVSSLSTHFYYVKGVVAVPVAARKCRVTAIFGDGPLDTAAQR
jgi:hypothetical protein